MMAPPDSASLKASPLQAEPFDRYHEDEHDVLWWLFPIMESPYVGSPLCDDWPFTESDEPNLGWTRLIVPASAALGASRPSPADEKMTPHAFLPMSSGKGNGEEGSADEEIWCADCEYQRDHEFHKVPVGLSPAERQEGK